MATNFASDSDITTHRHPGAAAGHVTRSTNVGDFVSGGGGLRIAVLDSDGETGPAYRRFLSDAWGTGDFNGTGGTDIGFAEGDTLYLQYRYKIPSYCLFHVFPGGGGRKLSILSNDDSSFQVYEHVIQNTLSRQIIQAYRQDGTFKNFEDSFNGSFITSDFNFQNQINHGLTVTDADSEDANYALWRGGANQNEGRLRLTSGAFRLYPDEWLTIYMRLHIGTFGGTSGNQWDLWAAREADSEYTHLQSHSNYSIGSNALNRINAIWLTPFNTGQQAETGAREDTYVLYDELICSTQPIACPTPISLPAWVPSVAQSARTGIVSVASSGTVADVDPCPARNCNYSANEGQAAVMDDWNGGVLVDNVTKTAERIIYHGGGHNGYFGNEIYGFNLDEDAPAAIRLNDPYPTPGGASYPWNTTFGELATGIPCSTHTNDQVQALPPDLGGGDEGSFLLLMHSSNHELGGGSTGYAHACDIAEAIADANTTPAAGWSRASTNAASIGGSAQCASCFDTKRGVYWLLQQNTENLQFYDPSTELWNDASPTVTGPHMALHSVATYDSLRDLIVIRDGGGSVRIIEPSDLSAGMTTVTTSGTAPSTAKGFVYVEALDRIYTMSSGSDIGILEPPRDGLDPATNTWVWRTESLTGSVPANDLSRPTYSRFRLAPRKRCFVVVNNTDDELRAVRPSRF